MEQRFQQIGRVIQRLTRIAPHRLFAALACFVMVGAAALVTPKSSSQSQSLQSKAGQKTPRPETTQTVETVQTAQPVQPIESGATVTVNDETVNVPPNQSFSRTFESDNGNTRVDVSIHNQSTGNATNTSKTELHVITENSTDTESVAESELHVTE